VAAWTAGDGQAEAYGSPAAVAVCGALAAAPLVTRRRWPVAALVAAAAAVCTAHTVKTHVGHLLTKLDARDRAQLVIAAYESGLVVPGSQDAGASEAAHKAASRTAPIGWAEGDRS
jgi:hypothetical protein